MKAYFEQEQPEVRIVEQGKLYIFIAVNGQWAIRQVEHGEEPENCWECDYAELVADRGQINTADVMANPEKYLDWEPPAGENLIEEISGLKKQNRDLLERLAETSEATVNTMAMVVDYIYEQDLEIIGGDDNDNETDTVLA